MGIGIFLADSHEIVRQGLRELFQKQSDMAIVGEAADGRITLERVKELQPDVVVMDIGLSHLDGIDATRQIVRETPNVKVVALSVHSRGRLVSEMLKAGVSGYLHKDCTFDELCHAIRAVINDQTYLSPKIASTVINDYVRSSSPAGSLNGAGPTDRERQLIRLLADGKSAKEIALSLDLSVKTVEGHRRHIMDKLEIQSLPELTKYAVLEGLTALES